MRNKIIFIGMMGCGKSAVSSCLAQKTKIQKFELDEIFVQKYGNIADFFRNFGEDEFRKKETEILKDTLKNREYIISAGGGVILSQSNRSLIFNNENLVIYLKAQAETIFERIKDDTARPLLKVENPKQEIKNILQKRQKYYEMANMAVSVDNKTIEEIGNEIWKRL